MKTEDEIGNVMCALARASQPQGEALLTEQRETLAWLFYDPTEWDLNRIDATVWVDDGEAMGWALTFLSVWQRTALQPSMSDVMADLEEMLLRGETYCEPQMAAGLRAIFGHTAVPRGPEMVIWAADHGGEADHLWDVPGCKAAVLCWRWVTS